jgi:hypothetical protein
MTIIDAILAHNREQWGGRYNPIVLTDGQTLTDAWWSLHETADRCREVFRDAQQ